MYHVSFPGLGIALDVNPVAVSLFSGTDREFNIYWYGIIIGAGFLLALFYALKSLKRYEINSDSFFDCVLFGLVAGIIGARLYYVAFKWDEYSQDLVRIFDIHGGGLAIYGGIIGGLGTACIVARIKKVNIPAMLDIGALGFLIGQGIGRWGNFINQEAFGTPTDLPWGMVSENTNGVAVHPCFLYESLWCLIGFGVLFLISIKWRKFNGQMFLMYLVWYGLERMIVEGLRTDSLMTPFLGLRVSQILSGVLVIVGAVLLIYGFVRTRGKPFLTYVPVKAGAETAETAAEEEKASESVSIKEVEKDTESTEKDVSESDTQDDKETKEKAEPDENNDK